MILALNSIKFISRFNIYTLYLLHGRHIWKLACWAIYRVFK